MELIAAFKEITVLLEDNKLDEALFCLDQIEDNIPDNGATQKFVGQLYQRIGDHVHVNFCPTIIR